MASAQETRAAEGTRPGGWLQAALALAFLWLLYSLPGAATAGDWRLLRLPLEALLLAALLVALPRRIARPLVWPLALLAAFAALLQILDRVTAALLGRSLNPVLDLELLPKLAELVQGAVGTPAALALLLACLLLLAALLLATRWSLGVLARLRAPRLALPALALTLIAWQLPGSAGLPSPVSAHLTPTLLDQGRRTLAMLDERATFGATAARDPLAEAPPADPFARLGEADLLVVFIESYGRAAVEDPRYADTTRAALDRLQAAAETRGFAAATGWSRAPTIGGQSWLAHASLLSGLWVDNQIRYAVLVSSGRRLLPHFLEGSGRESVLVMPAIVRAWPEADFMGFQRRYFADDLGYAGAPYNWVTMPDQYTLAAFETRERAAGGPPLFAMLALISSHAPWTPIAPVLDDWDAIGDGAVFSRWADEGDPPEVLWRDPERVREHYALSIDYVLRSLAGYLEWKGERPFLMIALGDHEAGGIVAGPEASRDVPVHLFASDPEFLEPFAEWGYIEGTRPDPEGQVTPMDAFRDFLLEAYSGSTAEAATRP